MTGRLAILSTGGTISAVADSRRRHGQGLGPVDMLQGLDADVAARVVDVEDIVRIPSRAMAPPEMLKVARSVVARFEQGATGIVVTHGTDTMEETAYALSLMVPARGPVVLTGAMRLPGEPGSDAPANLSDAIIAASDQRIAAFGAVVMFQNELHDARWVTKEHTSRVAAFASPGTGPIGTVVEKSLTLAWREPGRSEYLGLPERLDGPRVGISYVHAGADGQELSALPADLRGLVVAGTGGGHTPPAYAARLEQLIARGVTVVMSSRCAAGPSLRDTYAGEGGEFHLRDIGAIVADGRAPVKARLRLHVALALGIDPREAFA